MKKLLLPLRSPKTGLALSPVDFAMSYITRSGRVDMERLRKLSPRFAAQVAAQAEGEVP